MLMADSAATAGLRYVDPPANRNLLINGAMQVAQRGTSVTGITGDGYRTADRWLTRVGSLGTWTQTLEADAPTGSGFRNSVKLLCTTADAAPGSTDFVHFLQRLEGQDAQQVRKGTADAKQLTLSFWVKSNVTGTYIAELQDALNSRLVSAAYTVSASATWEQKTITFPADTTGVLDNDNTDGLAVRFWLDAGSGYTSGTLNTTWSTPNIADRAVGQTNLAAATNNYWQITGVQLETGPVATPFEFEPFEATLRKCQRYYQKLVRNGTFSTAGCYSTSAAFGPIIFESTMRAAPTITLAAAGGGTGQTAFLNSSGNVPSTVGTHAADKITENGFEFTASGYTSGFTAGNASLVWSNGSSTVYTASAEL
jgi:hypothetical protein